MFEIIFKQKQFIKSIERFLTLYPIHQEDVLEIINLSGKLARIGKSAKDILMAETLSPFSDEDRKNYDRIFGKKEDVEVEEEEAKEDE